MSGITRDTIKAATGVKVKFRTDEELYALFAYLSANLPNPIEAKEEKPAKKAKEPKAPKPTKAALLEPVDADASGGSAPTLGATDSLRTNKYRVQVLNPALCVARKIDEENPLVGSRPDDDGSKGKIFPEIQCSKKPVAGCLLCATCAKKETEYLADTSKPLKRWYGRLDEPMYAHALVVGCEYFFKKYPAGLPDAPVEEPAPKAKKPKAKAEAAPKAEAKVEAEEAPKPPKAKKPKKAKAEPTEEPAAEPEPEPEPEAEPEPEPEEPKPAKKPKKAKAEPEPEKAEPKAEKPKAKPTKSVSTTGPARAVEWVTFLHDGVALIRHTKTNNVYQCDTSKRALEDMVQRDKFEGKWVDGELDAYGEEDEE